MEATMNDLSLQSLFGMKGKNVVVTGGSRGIGYMLAAAFVQQGCNVYIFSRKPDHAAAEKLASKGPGKCESMVCDVENHEAIKAVAEEVSKRIGSEGLHVLINNSGAVWAEAFEDTSKRSFDKIMNVNVTGVFFVTQAFGPMLEKAGTNADPARVINIASIDGLGVPTFEEYAYGASKAGVLHLTRVMAGHLANRNITFNCISPGLFPSKMGAQVLATGDELVKMAIPFGRAGSAKEIAGAALFLAGPSGSYTTGANIVIDGGTLVKPRIFRFQNNPIKIMWTTETLKRTRD